MVSINIHNLFFSSYKIKLHILVHVTFSFSILRTKNVDGKFLQRLKIPMENFIGTKNGDGIFYTD